MKHIQNSVRLQNSILLEPLCARCPTWKELIVQNLFSFFLPNWSFPGTAVFYRATENNPPTPVRSCNYWLLLWESRKNRQRIWKLEERRFYLPKAMEAIFTVANNVWFCRPCLSPRLLPNIFIGEIYSPSNHLPAKCHAHLSLLPTFSRKERKLWDVSWNWKMQCP